MPFSPLAHVTADFLGVSAGQLRDSALLGGLLIAAAGAAGLGADGLPTMRVREHGIAGMLLLDDCHILVHAFHDRELLLVDVLAASEQNARRAIDVFSRRLTAREVHCNARERG